MQAAAGIRHRARQGKRLLGCHEPRTGDEEGPDFHRRIAIGGDVADDLRDLGVVQRVAIDLAPDELETVRRQGLADRNLAALRQTETPKSLFAKPDFARRQQALAIDDRQRGEDRLLSVADSDLAHRLKLLGREVAATAQQEGGILGISVDGKAANLEALSRGHAIASWVGGDDRRQEGACRGFHEPGISRRAGSLVSGLLRMRGELGLPTLADYASLQASHSAAMIRCIFGSANV